ncbi:MAG: zinc-ribbon domain-containing protein [Chitinophagaceae bacterium]|nr:zinc-ribbon domain-containing protein [Chitinophagaceae bacterium]
MKICQTCSSEIQDTFNFCPNCGSDLGKPLVCKKCQYENEPNSKFCQECGNALFERFNKQEIKPKQSKSAILKSPSHQIME